MKSFVEYNSRDEMMRALAQQVASELAAALAANGQASLSVPGGTTPGPFLQMLSQAKLDWAQVTVMLNDERFVPETDKRSNTGLLRRNLLQNEAAKAKLVPLWADAPTPEAAIPLLEGAVDQALPLDVLVVGMGEDMHTASLFPNADGLETALAPDAPTLMAIRQPESGEPRITLTAPPLSAAGHKHLLIAGVGKKRALEQAAQPGPSEQAPIRLLLDDISVHYCPE